MQTSAIRSKLCHSGLAAVLGMWVAMPVWAVADLSLTLPMPATMTVSHDVPLTAYLLPIGPFGGGKMQTTRTEGRMTQQAWRMPHAGLSTLDVMLSLREQITVAGFEVMFECATQACGGFDFRYGTDILPEPDMHVDLGDYQYLAASRDTAKGMEYLSLLVSRSPLDGYVQLTRIGALPPVVPGLTASTKTPLAQGASAQGALAPAAVAAAMDGMQATLSAGAPVVLEDLVFASGAAALQAGSYASLADLAAWLQANPQTTVMLVGHTDASGGLAANIALSKRRAESVRQVLLSDYGVAADQISADGVGPLAPRTSNLDAEGRTKNRRVEVIVTSTP